MGPTMNANAGMKLILLLIMVISSHSIQCPSKCHCTTTIFNCPSAGLTQIPNDIPSTVVEINLSNNPLLYINRSLFLKFPRLGTLFLNNVGLRGPIFLPKSLVNFGYSFNFITIESLRMMLKGKLHSLKRLELQESKLNVKEIFPILPRGIKNLVLNGNKLAFLGRHDLKCCIHLKEFQCKACSLKVIKPIAFDSVKEIAFIVLSKNELVDLPDSIFQGLPKPLKLELRDNKLKQFNASKLGLVKLQELSLGYNNIEIIDFQHSGIRDIGLESNRITRIGANSLGTMPFVNEFNLERNRIKEISKRAFEKVRLRAALVLHGNNIERLPSNLLKNTLVSTLFLHNNSLSNVDDFIRGMRSLPSTLTLYSNRNLKHLNTSVFRGFNQNSRLYVSCNALKSIKLTSKKRISIKCCPYSDLIITTPFRFLQYDGYECQWSQKHMNFFCKACRLGFYNGNDARTQEKSKCSPCPAGSFYQDEPASLSCKNCPIGQYVPPSRSPGKDASDCQTCPQGTNTSQLAGTRACSCLKGYYRRYRFGECIRCRHAGFECVRDYPQLKEGFWMTWNGTELSNRSCKHEFQSYIFNLKTVNNSYDRNTMHFNCQLPMPIKCPMRGSCQGGIDSNCSLGYTGVLCGVCSEGYKANFNRCVKCPHLYVIILRWIGLVALFILLCYIVSDKKDDRFRIRWMSGSDDESNRTIVDIFISSFKILIGFYQTLIGVMNAYNTINWPSNLVAIISMMEYIQFEIIRIPSLRCINPKWTIDAFKEFWLSLFIFFTFPTLCLICFLVRSCCLYYQETSDLCIKRRRNLCARNCVRTASLFMFITYPLMSARVTYILPASCDVECTVIHDGICSHSISFLRSDYSLNCPTMSTHRYTLVAAYCFLVLLCGLPLVLWIVLQKSLRKNGDRVLPGSSRQYLTTIGEDGMEEISDTEVENNTIDDSIGNERSLDTPPIFKSAIRFTYENYKTKFWFWEIIEMARKLIMTTGAALFLYHTKIGLSTLIIVGIAFAILHAVKKPIKDDFENFLQMLSLWIIPINLSAGAVIQSSVAGTNGPKGSDQESWKVGMFLIVINSLLIVLITGRFVKMGVEKIISRVV